MNCDELSRRFHTSNLNAVEGTFRNMDAAVEKCVINRDMNHVMYVHEPDLQCFDAEWACLNTTLLLPTAKC